MLPAPFLPPPHHHHHHHHCCSPQSREAPPAFIALLEDAQLALERPTSLSRLSCLTSLTWLTPLTGLTSLTGSEPVSAREFSGIFPKISIVFPSKLPVLKSPLALVGLNCLTSLSELTWLTFLPELPWLPKLMCRPGHPPWIWLLKKQQAEMQCKACRCDGATGTDAGSEGIALEAETDRCADTSVPAVNALVFVAAKSGNIPVVELLLSPRYDPHGVGLDWAGDASRMGGLRVAAADKGKTVLHFIAESPPHHNGHHHRLSPRLAQMLSRSLSASSSPASHRHDHQISEGGGGGAAGGEPRRPVCASPPLPRLLDVNAVDHEGYTALHRACEGCRLDAARLFISALGADAQLATSFWRMTPLHLFIKALREVRHRVPQEEREGKEGGETAIEAGSNGIGSGGGYTSSRYSFEFIALLVGAGCPIDAQTKGGFTALSYAAEFGCVDEVRILLAFGADARLRGVEEKGKGGGGGAAPLFSLRSAMTTAAAMIMLMMSTIILIVIIGIGIRGLTMPRCAASC